MAGTIRSALRKSLVLALALTAGSVGYVVHSASDTSSGRQTGAHAMTAKLTADDLLLATSKAQAIHLSYAGVTTLPELPSHVNDIPIQSFSFGVSRNTSITASGPQVGGKPNVSEINLMHATDQYSLPLLQQALTGPAPGVAATLYFTNISGTGGTPLDYLQIDLGDALITSDQMSSSGSTPTESISLTFLTMMFTYRIAGSTTMQTVNYNVYAGM
jgi:type VI secretion system secreted protein Hcp